mmetsp:Transcript_75492/g.219284  ORF Transcript_75492/g.219284 Transcript_75492/m.219284 type:complete len:397 (+) Transcript_75492:106-1296(+)
MALRLRALLALLAWPVGADEATPCSVDDAECSALLQHSPAVQREVAAHLPRAEVGASSMAWPRGVAPLRSADKEYLRFLNSSIGDELRREAWKRMGAAAASRGWTGPARRDGVPPEEFAARDLAIQSFPAADAAKHLNFAGPTSDIPEGLWGVWWMDQTGASSVASSLGYKFGKADTSERLVSFGPKISSGGYTWGARYEEDSRCVTPIESYGGPQWAALANGLGFSILEQNKKMTRTFSFCFKGKTDNTSEVVQLYQKVSLDSIAVGPITVGPTIGSVLGFVDAGNGLAWVPHGIVNITLERKPWGWDRVTALADGLSNMDPLEEMVISLILPDGLWDMVQMVKNFGLGTSSRYPMLQIVDGHGQKTPYYDEFLRYMQTVEGDKENLFYSMPLAP